MTRLGKRATAAVFLMTAGLLIWSLTRSADSEQPTQPPAGQPAGDGNFRRNSSSNPSAEEEREETDATARGRVLKDWDELLAWLGRTPRPSEDEIRTRLMEIRREWAQMDPQALSQAIDAILKEGKDAATDMEFTVGLHGFLSGWPTLRVFVLDMLAISDPEMAADIARKILDRTDSADEFAAGLRSLTREGMGRADDDELLSRFSGMLERDEWSSSPAFAEAMDLPRLVGSPEAGAKLIQWRGKSSIRMLAMDEFAAAHPAEMLEALGTSEDVSGPARASLMARADPADAAQIAAVDTYLRSPELSEDDAIAFLRIFPLRSATTGFRLYAGNPAPYTFDQIKAGDQAAHDQVLRWQSDPELQKYQPQLNALAKRLADWIEQAGRTEPEE